ncbi:MAG: D-alanyl-D-alanine carboxypeptidase [Lachnospira sp.]|nr:D-alanyl-D-alanine carboxypeptidase [Lachnospira sp.]
MKQCLAFLLVAVVMMSWLPIGAMAKEQSKITFPDKLLNKKKTEQQNETGNQADLSLSCESAVLMEPITGKVLYEKNKDKQLRPASVTKVMTLLLIMEAIDKGKFTYEDTVSVSAHAASMGGSQVFLEEGETQTVRDMLKCIVISSANDACVAMAEYVSGSEEAFVAAMNERAKELGMANTNFVNACGLDADGHLTTAYDIALMSRELTRKHKDIFEFTTIWMDTITHTTAKGSSEFGLSNTNKLIKQYNGATGLKTGSTSLAKFCLAATATRDNMDMLAVVMACPDSKVRTKEASKLLDYGFANCSVYEDKQVIEKPLTMKVECGKKDSVAVLPKENFQYVFTNGGNSGKITKRLKVKKKVTAPVKKGDKVGSATYYLDKEKLGSVDLVAATPVKRWDFMHCFKQIGLFYLLGHET